MLIFLVFMVFIVRGFFRGRVVVFGFVKFKSNRKFFAFIVGFGFFLVFR